MDDQDRSARPPTARPTRPRPGRVATAPSATVARPTRRAGRGRGRARTGRGDRVGVWAIAVVAAVLAALDHGAPTGLPVVDALWAAGLAVVVVLAASRARRWAWIVTSALLVVAAEGWWLVLAAAAVAAAVVAVRLHRTRSLGAAVGAGAVLVALHLPPIGGFGGSSLAAAVALAPLLVSGYRSSPARVRRSVRWAVLGAGAAVVVAGLGVGVAVATSWSSLEAAESAARDGLDAAEAGDDAAAVAHLDRAASAFAEASGRTSAWWARPARVVPVLGQHADALAVATEHGEAVTSAAAASAAAIDLDELRASGGAVDVVALRQAAPALRSAAEEIGAAEGALASVRSPWLASPVDDRVVRLADELSEVAPDAELGALAAEQLPGMLGADGPRRYLLAFTTPAESRGVGGFVGSWAVLEADDGRLQLGPQGRAVDINEAPGRAERRVTEPADYVARYGRFQPGAWFQDVTFSPDVPSSGSAAAQVFEQAGFGSVDGVAFVDPYGLAALLELTGPVQVAGRAEPLTAADAPEWLLRRQYLEAGDDEAREDLLGAAASATFDALLAAELPGPRRLADVLGPAAEQGRLSAVAFAPGAQALLERLGADRAFPRPGGDDLAALVTQNSANNKIDVFLHRSIAYDVAVDPGTGRLEATVRIELENRAPAEGLPDSVIGSNDQGLPPGTNRVFLTWYSPLGMRGATLDGAAIPMERQQELGWRAYSTFVEIPAGGRRTLELVLVGDVEPGTPYRLVLPVQPLVVDDELTVTVRPQPGWVAAAPDGAEVGDGGAVTLRPETSRSTAIEVPMWPEVGG